MSDHAELLRPLTPRALSHERRKALACDMLASALPLARKHGYGRVRLVVGERGEMELIAEKGDAADDGPLVLDV